jgi:hypothetical protein
MTAIFGLAPFKNLGISDRILVRGARTIGSMLEAVSKTVA